MTRTMTLALSLLLILAHARGKCGAQTSNDAADSRAVVYISCDNGAAWIPLSAGLPEDAQASFFARRGKEIILATDNRGLFATKDNRTRWEHLGRKLPDLKITALHVRGGELLVGVYRRGIYLSEDGGKKWVAMNEDLPNLNVRAILRYKALLLVGTDIGIYKKQDGSENWVERFAGVQISSLNSQDGKIIAGTAAGVMLSENGGDTWKSIHDAGALHNCSIVGGRICAMYISGDLFVSNDWGATWSEANYTPRERSYIYEVTTGRNSLLMSNNYGVFKSSDGGRNWDHVFRKGPDVFFFDFLVVDDAIYGGTRVR
jgi:photosystem II stability/assembly factor-like uncharacterized protein